MATACAEVKEGRGQKGTAQPYVRFFCHIGSVQALEKEHAETFKVIDCANGSCSEALKVPFWGLPCTRMR